MEDWKKKENCVGGNSYSMRFPSMNYKERYISFVDISLTIFHVNMDSPHTQKLVFLSFQRVAQQWCN